MHTHEQDTRVALEDGLGSVAVMDVPVNDGDAVSPSGESFRGGDRDVVEQTKSHRTIRLGVVPWRSGEGETALHAACHHGPSELHGATSGMECRTLAPGADVGIRIQHAETICRPPLELLDVRNRVDPQELLAGGRTRWEDGVGSIAQTTKKPTSRCDQALRRLRMATR